VSLQHRVPVEFLSSISGIARPSYQTAMSTHERIYRSAGTVPLVALAIGYAALPEQVPDHLQQQELSTRSRKPLGEFVFANQWGQAATEL